MKNTFSLLKFNINVVEYRKSMHNERTQDDRIISFESETRRFIGIEVNR